VTHRGPCQPLPCCDSVWFSSLSDSVILKGLRWQESQRDHPVPGRSVRVDLLRWVWYSLNYLLNQRGKHFPRAWVGVGEGVTWCFPCVLGLYSYTLSQVSTVGFCWVQGEMDLWSDPMWFLRIALRRQLSLKVLCGLVGSV